MFATIGSLGIWIRRTLSHERYRKPIRRGNAPVKLQLELLEGRVVPAIYYVTSLADSVDDVGDGTLRFAVQGMVRNPDTSHQIIFANNLNGTINLVAALPPINKSVQIIEGVSAAGGVTITRAEGKRCQDPFLLDFPMPRC